MFTRRGLPPCAETTIATQPVWSLQRSKAICLPSGDQSGWVVDGPGRRVGDPPLAAAVGVSGEHRPLLLVE